MRWITCTAIAVALVLGTLAGVVRAQPGGGRDDATGEWAGAPNRGMRHGPPGPPRFPFGRGLPPREVMETLGLSDAQRGKLSELHDAQLRLRIRAEADLRLAEMDLESQLSSERTDAAAVDAAVERVGELRHAMFKSNIATRLALRSILTSEQRKKLRSGVRERRSRE